MASAVDSRLAYARLSAVATASRLPTANRGSNNSYTTSWDTTFRKGHFHHKFKLLADWSRGVSNDFRISGNLIWLEAANL